MSITAKIIFGIIIRLNYTYKLLLDEILLVEIMAILIVVERQQNLRTENEMLLEYAIHARF
jgi:hypothetical protein